MQPVFNGLVSLVVALNVYAAGLPQLDSPPAVKAYVETKAQESGVSRELATAIVDCESGFVPQQSGHVKKGRRENSWGIWQINLDAHPEITRDQAMDVVWSTDWSIQELKKGRVSQWTCRPTSTKAAEN